MAAKPQTFRQAALFLAAGALNTCFGYAAFAVFMRTTGQKELAVVLATATGVAFNFGTYRTVFAKSGFERMPHFIMFYALVLAGNILLLRQLTAMGANAYIGQAIVLIIVTPISFVAMRSFVFPTVSTPRS